MSSRDVLGSGDVAAVAELAVEPSYISEIARKLQEVGPPYSNMSLNTVIRIVSRSAFAMSEDGRLEVARPGLGGQVESSPKTSLVGDGFAETDQWRSYTVVKSDTPLGAIRDEFVGMVDESVTMDQKIGQVTFLSQVGNDISRLSEEILQDQVDVFDYDFIQKSDYNDPGLDVYMEIGGKGYGIEISTRWVNPISGNYVSSKLEKTASMEKEREVPVDLLIMAPKFTDGEKSKRKDDDIVTLEVLPGESDGNPVIIRDFDQQPEIDVGPLYPLAGEAFEGFQDNLREVMRDFDTVEETEYRRQITEKVSEALSV